MANFMEDLWGSVFAAGPTPTLLIATNATFAALQLVLGALFIATYSIHFAILSVLCVGLWFSINWFANELRQAQGKEEEAERLRKQRKATTKADNDWKGGVGDSADDEGEDTETEGQGMQESGTSAVNEPAAEEEQQQEGVSNAVKPPGHYETGGASTGLQAGGSVVAPRQRRAEVGDRSGEVSSSTDSEWEKVEGGR
ncbi:hypothetical protein LTR36_007580 [Oleoguttula mirabilis]|uniref:Uncharacterized protein n=1 Tax=Oleoguttula mirabilis TaxID=1507867 RepID=A0AAV9JTW1_9PEZI|nr:hypothetical protein LTR36_007580 [Oleoguttula mirabilis]